MEKDKPLDNDEIEEKIVDEFDNINLEDEEEFEISNYGLFFSVKNLLI